ncbi:hypothetical protein ACM16X_04940 [Haloarcula japonica]|uniref:hypothetical protein n=1 Tax=Haloarcula japonica TaxID=29282 RepID=UPI0039F68AA2
MSDADVEQPEQDDAVGDEDQPEMEEDEFVDVDLDAIADDVEAEAGASGDADDSNEPETTEETTNSADLSPDGESWGDMYVGTLTTVSNAIIEEHGTDGAEQVDEDLAKQLHLDEYFDEWMENRGKADMPPEQALLIGTTMFMVVVVGTKTDLPSKLLQEADF